MGENDDILNIALEEKYRARTYTKSQESGPEHFVNNRSERPIISTKPVIASFDSEVPFTYVLVLQKNETVARGYEVHPQNRRYPQRDIGLTQ